MKWIGQHIVDLISRFRSLIYLEAVENTSTDPDKFLCVESDGKVGFRTGTEVLSDIGAGTGDITDVTVRTVDDGQNNTTTSGAAQFNFAGGEGVDISSDGSGNVIIATEDASSSNKGVATFNTANFAVTSGDVTIKSGGVDLTAEVTGELPIANFATKDEDDMVSDSASHVPTQQSVKAYVDTKHYDILHINGFMSAASTNQFMTYGGNFNFNIGATPYVDGSAIGNNNASKWGHYLAMSDCTVDRIMYRATDTGGGSGDDYSFEIWKFSAVNNGSGNTTVTKLLSIDITGDASANYMHHVIDTAGYELDEGETLLPAVRKTSGVWSGTIFFECALRFRYDNS